MKIIKNVIQHISNKGIVIKTSLIVIPFVLVGILLIIDIAPKKQSDIIMLETDYIEENKNNKENKQNIDPKLGNSVIAETSDLEEPANDSVKENDSNSTSTKQNGSSLNSTNKNDTNFKTTTKDVHTHNWITQTQSISHQEEGHYNTEVVEDAYDEKIYAWRTLCNKCGTDITDLGTEGITYHSAVQCESGYHNDYIVVDTIHHEAVTKQVWIVDFPAYTETITSYKCECGATDEAPTPQISNEALDLINKERVKLGLQPAVLDPICERIALIRAREVYNLETVTKSNAHEGFMKFQNTNFALGECVAWRYAHPLGAVVGWMNSPGHRDTLMDEERVYLAIAYCGGKWVAVNSWSDQVKPW